MTVTEVVAALIWEGDRFMICQRPAHKTRGLLWEFVGGKVEPGETKEQALIRECREELAVTVSVGDVFMDVVHEYPDLLVHLTLFHASIAVGEPQKIEHNDIRWITTAEIPNYPFCPADEEILCRLRSFSKEAKHMRVNFGPKPICYPQPVFILAAYDEKGVPNAMNAAWGGISDDEEISFCISAGHKTTKDILVRKAFTVSMADVAHLIPCDYVGIVSGNEVPDKLEKCGFHTEPSAFVDAPLIQELPMALECKLKSYDPASCRLVGEIVNVCADEFVLTDGKIDPAKLRPITFDPVNNAYLVLGEKVGNAFQDGLELQ